jgi:hypothetical protein
MYACMHVCMYALTVIDALYMYTYMAALMALFTYRVFSHIVYCIHICVCTYRYIYIDMYIYIYMYMYLYFDSICFLYYG